MRRATFATIGFLGRTFYFYPRSPCGERLPRARGNHAPTARISTHALHAESDAGVDVRAEIESWISTHALHAESDTEFTYSEIAATAISTHALHAESDNTRKKMQIATTYFYPRSPCGERR